MPYYHVIQVVKPGHKTSYKTGRNWISSHESEAAAHGKASLFNDCRYFECKNLGWLEYVVDGPSDDWGFAD